MSKIPFFEPLASEEYDDLKEFIGLKGYDLDLLELHEERRSEIKTRIGIVNLSLAMGNVWTVKATADDYPNEYGQCSTYDIDSYGLFSAVESAVLALFRDIDSIFVNSPA